MHIPVPPISLERAQNEESQTHPEKLQCTSVTVDQVRLHQPGLVKDFFPHLLGNYTEAPVHR